MTNGDSERPLTTRELAKHLSVTTRTVANWRAKGRIPFWSINARNVRYSLRAVERALSKLRVASYSE
jgi:excisionase family DNA binding protein